MSSSLSFFSLSFLSWSLVCSFRFSRSFSRSILPYSLIGVFLALLNRGGYSSKVINSYGFPNSRSFFCLGGSLGLKVTRLVWGVKLRTVVTFFIPSMSTYSKAKILRLELGPLMGLWVYTLIFYFSCLSDAIFGLSMTCWGLILCS